MMMVKEDFRFGVGLLVFMIVLAVIAIAGISIIMDVTEDTPFYKISISKQSDVEADYWLYLDGVLFSEGTLAENETIVLDYDFSGEITITLFAGDEVFERFYSKG